MMYTCLVNNSRAHNWKGRAQPAVTLLLTALWLVLNVAFPTRSVQALSRLALPVLPEAGYAIGDPVTHVRCEPGYTPTFYARGLRSPDGLAFDPGGVLHVVEERGSRVSRIEPNGSTTPILSGLNSPEGIAFDDAGNLYVVEDARKGRLLRRSPDGQVTTLAEGLQGPEGVVAVPGPSSRAAPTVYVTESNVQYVRHPYDLETGIAAVASPGSVTHVITHTPTAHWDASGSTVAFWSYAGLTRGPGGRLYVTNELSGQEVTRQIELVPDKLAFRATLFTEDSVFAIDPARGTRTLVASGLLSPEGLSFSVDGGYPLYVAEENVGYKARLSRVDANGRRTTVCDSFRGLEDVTVDANGDLYVSEDLSGSVIRIQVSDPAPGAPGSPPPARESAGTTDPRETPGSGSLNAGLLRRLWRRLAAFARWIVDVFRSRRAGDAQPTARPSRVQVRTTPSRAAPSLQPGAHAVVRNTGGQGLRCRAGPGLEAEIVSRLQDGTTVPLLDGPVRQDGYEWWRIEPPDGKPCWTAGDWLYPADP